MAFACELSEALDACVGPRRLTRPVWTPQLKDAGRIVYLNESVPEAREIALRGLNLRAISVDSCCPCRRGHTPGSWPPSSWVMKLTIAPTPPVRRART